MSVTFLISLVIIASPHVVSTPIEGSLERSLVRKVPSDGPALAAQIARLLKWEGDIVRNIHRGDQLKIVYNPNEVPELIALWYNGLQIKMEAYQADDGTGVKRFYGPNGVLIEPHMKKNPVPSYVQITEAVQWGRGKRKHHGIDLKAPTGTPILLPFSGTVQRVNWLRRVNGNCVEIRYRDGNLGRFLHLHDVSKALRAGKKLSAGSPLGSVGSTGRSGAPHLHYEIRSPAGKVVDPFKYHGTEIGRLPSNLKNEFLRVRNQYRGLMQWQARAAR